MKTFCTLHIRSPSQDRLPKELFRPSARMRLEFKDWHDQNLRASRARVSKAIGRALREIPRYHWQIASDAFVDGDDIEGHLLCIFHLLPPDARLCELLAGDFDYWISTFWVGNGTGGGVLLSVKISDLLARHKVQLAIGFYLDEIVQKAGEPE
ncbi:hypothetical protein [Cupriavidus alkaliphilus]|uniref:hypothetical protein n=1 Tax=Cupriavidus alkaliphilus TaxID=942866 RepID=UPI00339D6C25